MFISKNTCLQSTLARLLDQLISNSTALRNRPLSAILREQKTRGIGSIKNSAHLRALSADKHRKGRLSLGFSPTAITFGRTGRTMKENWRILPRCIFSAVSDRLFLCWPRDVISDITGDHRRWVGLVGRECRWGRSDGTTWAEGGVKNSDFVCLGECGLSRWLRLWCRGLRMKIGLFFWFNAFFIAIYFRCTSICSLSIKKICRMR